MIPSDHLEADLRASLAALAATPLAELLLQQGILRRLATEHLQRRLRDSVAFSAEEEQFVIARLWQGVAGEPPTALTPGWIEALPAMLRGPLEERWHQIRLQKWMEENYRDRIEPYFLERRDDLEQVVYGMIRLRNQGAAEELYLRILDDQADFGELARQHSLGEERFTRGLVGPMLISQPHPSIRSVLQNLAVGDLHPPFRVENWILLVRMEHRQPARLNDSTMLQLCQELLQKDLDLVLDQRLAEIYPALLEREGVAPQGTSPPIASPTVSTAPAVTSPSPAVPSAAVPPAAVPPAAVDAEPPATSAAGPGAAPALAPTSEAATSEAAAAKTSPPIASPTVSAAPAVTSQPSAVPSAAVPPAAVDAEPAKTTSPIASPTVSTAPAVTSPAAAVPPAAVDAEPPPTSAAGPGAAPALAPTSEAATSEAAAAKATPPKTSPPVATATVSAAPAVTSPPTSAAGAGAAPAPTPTAPPAAAPAPPPIDPRSATLSSPPDAESARREPRTSGD